MEIRKQEKEYRKKLSVGALVLGLVALSMTADVRDAWADPHGIFYTAIGQQQLFFNVLAALDQADYVETAFDREARRKAREAVSAEQPFAKETESGGRFTKETEVASDSGYLTQPGTPTLLNRAVTLDGADLYTDQLVREFGAESARRNAAAELLQTLCAYGFGIKECDNEIKPGLTPEQRQAEVLAMEQRRREAVVVDPLEWQAMPVLNGVLAALNSGTEEDETERALRWVFQINEPYAFSNEVALWRQQINQLPELERPAHLATLQGMIDEVATQYMPDKSVSWPFLEIKTEADGSGSYRHLIWNPISASDCWPNNRRTVPCLEYNYGEALSQAGLPTDVASYVKRVNDAIFSDSSRLSNVASEAFKRVEYQQGLIENEGLLADANLKSNPPPSPSPDVTPLSSYGELSLLINNPVAARKASVYGIPNVLGQLATSQQASSLTGLDNPGGVQLVKRSGSSGTPGSGEPECSNGVNDDGDNYIDYPLDPECASATDTSESQSGPQAAASNTGPQVAGALDLLFKPSENFFDKDKDPTSPSANIISPILEFGARHALRVMTAGKWRPGTTAGVTCGFTCD